MGWLSRLFPEAKQPEPRQASTPAAPASGETIPAERMGLHGEYDESGLAKRVALAFDADPTLDDINTLWVAQTSSRVVLKGKVPNQALLDKMVQVAGGVSGATEVDISQVTVG